ILGVPPPRRRGVASRLEPASVPEVARGLSAPGGARTALLFHPRRRKPTVQFRTLHHPRAAIEGGLRGPRRRLQHHVRMVRSHPVRQAWRGGEGLGTMTEARSETTKITVNGRYHEVGASADTPLLYVLRNDLE